MAPYTNELLTPELRVAGPYICDQSTCDGNTVDGLCEEDITPSDRQTAFLRFRCSDHRWQTVCKRAYGLP